MIYGEVLSYLSIFFLCTHYAQRGGRSTDSAGCGLFFVAGGSAFSHINWFFGAALSFVLHIMLFVVVFLTLVPVVERFVFVLLLVLLVSSGSVALLYYKKIKDWYYSNPLFIFILLGLLIYCLSLFLI